ncbi:head GIN domain-containing protein [Chloroflexota bacterium]
MENKDSNEVNDIIKTIMSGLKDELETMKSEIKEDLKTELDNIRATLKDEMEDIRTREPSSPETPFPPDSPFPPPPHQPFDDFDVPGFMESFDVPGFMASDEDRESNKFDIADFSTIHISGIFEVKITQSDTYKINVNANHNFFRNLDVSKEGGTLRVRHSRHIGWRAALVKPRVEITLPVLKELRLSGAASVKISGFRSSDSFKVEMSGACSLEGDINAGNADFDVSGASRVRLYGSSRDAVIRASGANRIDLHEFTIENAAVKLSGASRLSANVSGRLDARLSGASYFGWRGEPVMGDIRTSGAARLSKE